MNAMVKWGERKIYRSFTLILNLFLIIGLSTASNARIIRVAQDGDGSDGETWETAFQTISAALVASSGGDHIWVKQGTYVENVSMAPNTWLFGGFAGTETDEQFELRSWRTNESIIDGSSRGPELRSKQLLILMAFVLHGDFLGEEGGFV